MISDQTNTVKKIHYLLRLYTFRLLLHIPEELNVVVKVVRFSVATKYDPGSGVARPRKVRGTK